MINDIFKLNSRIQITPKDLQKCMNKILKIGLDNIDNDVVKIVHPGMPRLTKVVTPYFIEFIIDHKNKNIKLSSDVAIVLKY